MIDYSKQSDEALMQSFAKGSISAFETLYGRHKDALYRYILRQVSDRELASDLYQELWSRIIKSNKSYSAQAKWTTWAYRIAHNLIIDHFRTLKALEPEVEMQSLQSPEAQHRQEELGEHILQCLEKLPAAQREIFLFNQETDLSLVAIAEIVGASHEAIKSRLRYARQALKECLSRFGIVSSKQSGN